MGFRDYWYIVAESHELAAGAVLKRKILDEWVVVWRCEDGTAVAAQDRCMHRAGRLSEGTVVDGCVRCPYHGWTYDKTGEVVAVPAEGENFKRIKNRRVKTFGVREVDDFVYVRLAEEPLVDVEPFPMPKYKARGYHTIRLQNRMQNNVTNCVENFIDIPHTVFVHPGIFRTQRNQKIDATVERKDGVVFATYRNETDNLGFFAKLLNPDGHEIHHTDAFYMPNVTSVEYTFGPRRHFIITSQSVPVSDEETLVYTDLTFDYGPLTWFAKPIVRQQGQAVIDQDIEALASQMNVIRKYGEQFSNTSADIIHVFVESIRNEIAKGGDPRELAPRSKDISFFV